MKVSKMRLLGLLALAVMLVWVSYVCALSATEAELPNGTSATGFWFWIMMLASGGSGLFLLVAALHIATEPMREAPP